MRSKENTLQTQWYEESEREDCYCLQGWQVVSSGKPDLNYSKKVKIILTEEVEDKEKFADD